MFVFFSIVDSKKNMPFEIMLDDGEHENILDEYNEDFDFDYIYTNVDEEDQYDDYKCSPTPQVDIKKSCIDTDVLETLPDYLQINNELLAELTTVRIKVKELLLLKHKLVVLHIDEELWCAFEKFGAGQWETVTSKRTAVDRRVWFDDVKKYKPIDVSVENQQKLYEITVQDRVAELKTRIQQYENEFKCKLDTDNELESKIDAFIEQYGMPVLRAEFNYKIALFEYDYDIELLQRALIEQKPTAEQVRLFVLCSK